MELREFLHEMFAATLRFADLRERMQADVRVEDGRLLVGEHGFALGGLERVLIVAVGKAAGPMSEQMMETLRS